MVARPGAMLRRVSRGAIGGLLTLFAAGPPASAVAAQSSPAPAPDDAECLACHADPQLSRTLPAGEQRSLFVDPRVLEGSVHGGQARCTDCHPSMAQLPHPERPPRSLAEYRAGFREACKACHFDNYSKTLDSVHFRVLRRGDVHAPTCVSCHGGHDVGHPREPRSKISVTCAACHSEISATFARSVHGKAVLENNPDVPVCTDCHRSHDIVDPRGESWRLETPKLCGSCHADAEKMARYGLSPNVLKTYLADFHGTTASLARPRDAERAQPVTALCTDCHGVHDISKVDDPRSGVLRANLVKTCARCHPGASENFPAAWLSHYEPSWEKAPVVHGVRVFYSVLIPLMIGGLVLQILLHLWRVMVNR